MPLPAPRKGESKEDFIARFMSDPQANQEYPDADQRYAVAIQMWEAKER